MLRSVFTWGTRRPVHTGLVVVAATTNGARAFANSSLRGLRDRLKADKVDAHTTVDLDKAYADRVAMAQSVAKDREERDAKHTRFAEWQAKQREKGTATRLARLTRRAEAKKRADCNARAGRMIIIEQADPFDRARGAGG